MEEEGEAGMERKKVMVAIDESESSRYALKWALQYLHESLAVNPQLVLFTAQPIADYRYVYASTLGDTSFPEVLASIQEKQKETAIALLEKTKAICRENGISAETATEVGDPKRAICEAAEKLKVDLLLVGSHGRGAIKRALMGSVSNYCVENSPCPVIVVRKQN